MRAIEITEENLEDLLAYDDLFLDYFNAFLGLPVFPQPLYYNRLTGTFLEVQGTSNALGQTARATTPPYGATDEERERMLEWAKNERLPLFLRTELFREFKLCKLLLRALDDRYSSSRGGSSRMLRGFSRQTESYVSSLSNSADNSANDADFDDENVGWGDYRRSALYKYKRPGSRAFSLPTRIGLARTYSRSASSSRDTKTESATAKSGGKQTLSADSKSRQHASRQISTMTQGTQGASDKVPDDLARGATFLKDRSKEQTMLSIDIKAKNKPRSAKTKSSLSSQQQGPAAPPASSRDDVTDNVSQSRKSVTLPDVEMDQEVPVVSDYDDIFGEDEPETNGEVYVNFAEDVVSDAQTETDVRHLEGKHKMTIQQMKEQILGQVDGMDRFKQFLNDTAGQTLLRFWLDCENFKDTIEEYDEHECFAQRSRLFRDIQDRHKLSLTSDAKRQIAQSANNAGLGHTIFIRTQYDVLRRLRAYWVPRFLIHKERMDELRVELKHDGPPRSFSPASQTSASCFFPSISLVNSMPVIPEELMQIARTTSWDHVSKGGRKLDDRVKSAKPNVRRKPKERTLREKFILALMTDKSAGGPFKLYLQRLNDATLLSKMLFWEDVTDYGVAEDRSADRLLRMHNAWDIFNKYMSVNSRRQIGLTSQEKDQIHKTLLRNKDFVEADLFEPAKNASVDTLEKAWVRFLKEDLKAYIECHMRGCDSPPSTADDFEVMIDDGHPDGQLIVRRPRPWVRRMAELESEDGYPPSTESERGQRLRTALSMAESIDEARKIEQRKRAKERRKLMEKERKKAIKAAKQRQKEAKMKKNVKFTPKKEGEEGEEGQEEETGSQQEVEGAEGENQEKNPTFAESVGNKTIIQMFKNYITEYESKEVMNMLNIFMDIEAYNNLGDGKGAKQKKEIQANFIHKTYMEQGARKKVHLSDSVYNRLRTEKDRPKSATLREAQKYIVKQLEEYFQTFFQHKKQEIDMMTQAEELGIDSKSMANMSKVELAMRSDDPSVLNSWQKKKGKVGGKPDGRAQPTREDKVEFLVQLSQAAAGHLPLKMLYFYKYLVKHGEEDGMPLIDKDLFFYCEVQKFKDGSHQFSDEEMLRRKVQSVLEVFLDSATPPQLQIDLPSDIQQKAIRGAQRYLAGKDINANIFDEAQFHVFKELLPYWAGFVKTYKAPEDENKRPLTKHERERKKRLEEFMTYRQPSAKTLALPQLPKGSTIAAFSFTLNDGLKWREEGVSYEVDLLGDANTTRNPTDSEDTGSNTGGATPASRRGSVLQQLKRSTTNTNLSLADSSRKNSIVV